MRVLPKWQMRQRRLRLWTPIGTLALLPQWPQTLHEELPLLGVSMHSVFPASPPLDFSASQCIDGIEAMLTRDEFIGYLRGNSMKYRWRFPYKNGMEDLKKAEWYEKRLLRILENNG